MSAVEALSAELHAVYQREARRQAGAGDDTVRHPDDYDALPEHTKEYDRVLARFILEREADARRERDAARERVALLEAVREAVANWMRCPADAEQCPEIDAMLAALAAVEEET